MLGVDDAVVVGVDASVDTTLTSEIAESGLWTRVLEGLCVCVLNLYKAGHSRMLCIVVRSRKLLHSWPMTKESSKKMKK